MLLRRPLLQCLVIWPCRFGCVTAVCPFLPLWTAVGLSVPHGRTVLSIVPSRYAPSLLLPQGNPVFPCVPRIAPFCPMWLCVCLYVQSGIRAGRRNVAAGPGLGWNWSGCWHGLWRHLGGTDEVQSRGTDCHKLFSKGWWYLLPCSFTRQRFLVHWCDIRDMCPPFQSAAQSRLGQTAHAPCSLA